MKQHRSRTGLSSEPITGIAEATAERVRLGGELLHHLALAVGANERAQRRFRTAVLIRLSRIESIVEMILGAQIAHGHKLQPGYEEKVHEQARGADAFISLKSKELFLAMVKHLHEETPPSRKRGRVRTWRSSQMSSV
jgi:hypothetical protein